MRVSWYCFCFACCCSRTSPLIPSPPCAPRTSPASSPVLPDRAEGGKTVHRFPLFSGAQSGRIRSGSSLSFFSLLRRWGTAFLFGLRSNGSFRPPQQVCALRSILRHREGQVQTAWHGPPGLPLSSDLRCRGQPRPRSRPILGEDKVGRTTIFESSRTVSLSIPLPFASSKP
jgi:hypothetical protein